MAKYTKSRSIVKKPSRQQNHSTFQREPFKWLTAMWLCSAFFASDFITSIYVIFVSTGQAALAAVTSAALVALGFVGIEKFLRQPLYIIPILLGALLGTYISISIFK